MQILQVTNTLDNIDTIRFDEPYGLSHRAEAVLTKCVRSFWETLENLDDVRSSTTAMLICGWGAPFAVRLNIKDSEAPPHWDIVWLSFVEAFILGHLDNGRLIDILRIREQRAGLERDGFSFHNSGNLVNLYGFWRDNEFRLVPTSIQKTRQPCHLSIHSGYQSDPTYEVINRRDEQALFHPQEGYKVVTRLSSQHNGDKHIYGCEENAHNGVFTGAYNRDGRVWWITISNSSEGSSLHRFKIWETVLHWLNEVGPAIVF